MDKVEWIWRDGEMIPWDQANVHVLTHGLHYGLAVFEGIRCYAHKGGGGAIFRLDEHIERLFESAHICLMEVPHSVESVIGACKDIVTKNGMTDGCYLRPLVYSGYGSLGIAALTNPIHTMVAGWRWGTYLGEEGVKNGIRVTISGWRRPRGDAFSPKGKISGQYVLSILAKREAMAAGFEEALFLDDNGYAVEGTGENLFVIKNGVVRTPSIGQAILGGITRDTAMTLLRAEKIDIVEGPITRDELFTADEIFLTGTAAEVTPVREIDGRVIGKGKPGPVTEMMKKNYAACVRGELEEYAHWITRIE